MYRLQLFWDSFVRMFEVIALALAGFGIGTLGTLIGAGGGFIMVPMLLLVYPALPPAIVTATSMAVVALNAISGSVAYARNRRIDYKAGMLFAVFTIPGSILGVLTVTHVPLSSFHFMSGVLLLVLGGYLFVKHTRKKAAAEVYLPDPRYPITTLTDSKGHTYTYSYNRTWGILISIVVGFLSPVLGIGGGIIHVPAMTGLLRFPMHVATATSHFILSVMASVTVVTHLLSGSYNAPGVQMMILGLAIGVIPGAQMGAYLSQRLHSRLILQLLAVSLALVGLRMLLL